MVLLILASQVARITGMSHWHPAITFELQCRGAVLTEIVLGIKGVEVLCLWAFFLFLIVLLFSRLI
jgi:hypothetical protein